MRLPTFTKHSDVRGRRLALATTALRSPPIDRRTALRASLLAFCKNDESLAAVRSYRWSSSDDPLAVGRGRVPLLYNKCLALPGTYSTYSIILLNLYLFTNSSILPKYDVLIFSSFCSSSVNPIFPKLNPIPFLRTSRSKYVGFVNSK